MAPRQRKGINRPLPHGMRGRDGYYSWRNPFDGVEHGLGRDRQKAISEARAANAYIAQRQASSLVDRISGAAQQSWGAWLDKYEKLLAARNLKPNTRRTYKSLLLRARRTFPSDIPISQITTRMAADAIDALIGEGHARLAQFVRSFLADCFREAIAQGWVRTNPLDATRAVAVTVRRARLSMETFQAVYRADIPVWLRNAMALAIVSAQRREDIAHANEQNTHFRLSLQLLALKNGVEKTCEYLTSRRNGFKWLRLYIGGSTGRADRPPGGAPMTASPHPRWPSPHHVKAVYNSPG